MKKWLKENIIFIALLFVGVVLRFFYLEARSELTFDEMISWKIAGQNTRDLWKYLAHENNPPLHYYYLHFWRLIFGENIVIARLSSVIISIFSIGILYKLIKKNIGKFVATGCALLISLSAYHLFIATELRMYNLVFLFGLLSIYYYLEILKKESRKKWFLYFIFSLLGLYTHLSFVLLIGAQFFYLFFIRIIYKKEIAWKKWFVIFSLVFLFFYPWLIVFVGNSLSLLNKSAWYLNEASGGASSFLKILISYLISGRSYQSINLILFTWIAILVLSIFIYQRKIFYKKSIQEMFFAWLVIFYFIFGMVMNFWIAKYYIITSLGWFLLLAIGMKNISSKIKDETIAKVLLLTITFTILIPHSFVFYKKVKDEKTWQNTFAYIDLKTEDERKEKILMTSFISQIMLDYYSGDLEVLSAKPEKNNDDLLQAVKYNWRPVLEPIDLKILNGKLEKVEKLLVIHQKKISAYINSDLTLDFLQEKNWQRVSAKKIGGFSDIIVYEYTRKENL